MIKHIVVKATLLGLFTLLASACRTGNGQGGSEVLATPQASGNVRSVYCIQEKPAVNYGLVLSVNLQAKNGTPESMTFLSNGDNGFGFGDLTQNGDGTGNDDVLDAKDYLKTYTPSLAPADQASSPQWKGSAAFLIPIAHQSLKGTGHILYFPKSSFAVGSGDFKARLKYLNDKQKDANVILSCNEV